LIVLIFLFIIFFVQMKTYVPFDFKATPGEALILDAGFNPRRRGGRRSDTTPEQVTDLPNRQEVWFRVFALGTQQRKDAPSTALPCFVQ
jgi:hypothetical protein